jgi:hypothetical protein
MAATSSVAPGQGTSKLFFELFDGAWEVSVLRNGLQRGFATDGALDTELSGRSAAARITVSARRKVVWRRSPRRIDHRTEVPMIRRVRGRANEGFAF